MHWLLIIILTNAGTASGGYTVETVPLESKKQCEIVQAAVEDMDSIMMKIKTRCVQLGGQ